MNFAVVDIFHISNISIDVDNVKTVNGTFSLTVMAENFSNYGHETYISASVRLESIILFDFVIFLCFCSAPNNSINSDLKSCSKSVFYSSESIKLQKNLNNIKRNTKLANFVTSKLRNKSKPFLKFYQILLLFSGNISLNPGPCQIQFNDDKIWEPIKTLKGYIFVI